MIKWLRRQAILLFLLLLYFTRSSALLTFGKIYRKLPVNTAVQGELGATLVTVSSTHCSASCSEDQNCSTFMYKEQQDDNCVIIHPEAGDGQTFLSDSLSALYRYTEGTSSADCDKTWFQPSNWPVGDQPVVYRSFDTTDTDCMELENGGSLVTGQVSRGVSIDRLLSQTIVLTNLSVACILSPETCSNGASLVFWVNVVDCPNGAGIMSSHSGPENGFRLVCGNTDIKYRLYLQGSKYETFRNPKPSGWIHIAWVINDNGLGFSMYHDGGFEATYTTSDVRGGNPPTGQVVIGKKYLNVDADYSSLTVDELSLWNRKLTAQEITDIFTIP